MLGFEPCSFWARRVQVCDPVSDRGNAQNEVRPGEGCGSWRRQRRRAASVQDAQDSLKQRATRHVLKVAYYEIAQVGTRTHRLMGLTREEPDTWGGPAWACFRTQDDPRRDSHQLPMCEAVQAQSF